LYNNITWFSPRALLFKAGAIEPGYQAPDSFPKDLVPKQNVR